MKTVTGDLIDLAKSGGFDVIVHGCNCFHTMGAGIAKRIRLEFPEAYEADRVTKKGDASKLGSITWTNVQANRNLIVVNAYTQFHHKFRLEALDPNLAATMSANAPLVDYDAVRLAFRAVKKIFTGRRIAYPKIGAGLARGDWSVIERIIDQELVEEDHTLVVLPI